jgi:hypothetical protein
MRWGGAILVVVACQSPPASNQVVTAPNQTPASSDGCGNGIPDCIAVCAFRETHRTEFLEFYERRCAAVVLGKNPDKVVMATDAGRTPQIWVPLGATSSSSSSPVVDAEPAECKAARTLRDRKRDAQAEVLAALCAAKGGDAGI